MSLPWKIEKQVNYHTVRGIDGSYIENVPDYGSMLVGEFEFLTEIQKKGEELTNDDFIKRAVCFFMRSRFELDESVTDAEILDPKRMTIGLRQALFNFFLYGPDGKPVDQPEVISEEGEEKKQPTGENSIGDSSLPTQDIPTLAVITTPDALATSPLQPSKSMNQSA